MSPVCQSTDPDLPNPDCEAPDAKDTVSPLAPIVIAVVNTGSLIEHGTELFNVEQELAYDFFRTMVTDFFLCWLKRNDDKH